MNNQYLEEHNALVMSYMTLRKAIGVLGILFPVILSLGDKLIFQEGIQLSICHYYFTGMRTVFVGCFWAAAVFLFAYRGYGRVEDFLAKVGCIAAVGITVFPTDESARTYPLHLLFGGLFLAVLIIFPLFLFTKTDSKDRMTLRKFIRNGLYRVCGIVMLVGVVLIGIILLFSSGKAPVWFILPNPVFWLETFALWAFGVSWLTKGIAMLQDPAVP